MDKNTPNPVDLHVGARVRLRRRALGMSQEDLANDLGLTFQQIQKYERGANRISASKLYDIACSLSSPLAYFFEGLADPAAEGGEGADTADFDFRAFMMTSEGVELARLFPAISRARVRRRLLDLVRSLAEPDADQDSAA
ncbi:MAG: Cro/Cl family transcriptional regulator [Caulobacteraceae bacterium]|nr:Cro/Cl family transcriptional regulator [Caulobacteraceae bacterium]